VSFSLRGKPFRARLKDLPQLREFCEFDQHRSNNAPRRRRFQSAQALSMGGVPYGGSDISYLPVVDACEGPSGPDQATHRKSRRQARRGFRFPASTAVVDEARDLPRDFARNVA
jgi:hypothetical protein